MARIAAETVQQYQTQAADWLAANAPALTLDAIATGRDAWIVAHQAGIVRAAYALGRDVVDAHIQTALERIFPNAVFRDPKRY